MANEQRLIDANALKKAFRTDNGAYVLGHSIVRLLQVDKIIDEQPAVDAVEVVRAYWAGNEAGEWHCSRCGEYAADGGFEQTNYCPNCCAKMDGVNDNGKA